MSVETQEQLKISDNSNESRSEHTTKPPTQDTLKSLAVDLRSLVFYRDLLTLEPLKEYLTLLDLLTDPNAEAETLTEQYALWNYELLQSSAESSWAYWLAGEILRSVNPLTKAPEAPSQQWREALEKEVQTLLLAIDTDGAALSTRISKKAVLYDSGKTSPNPTTAQGTTQSFAETRHQLTNYKPQQYREAAESILLYHRRFGHGLPTVYKAMLATPDGITGITRLDPILPEELFDYSGNLEKLTENTENFLHGKAASHVLLYGTRGCGKSSAVKAMLNRYEQDGLRLIEINPRHLGGLGELMDRIAESKLRFILFIDDLSFQSTDQDYTQLKSFLQGGALDLPDNCRLYVTSNRRHLVLEQLDATEQELYANDGLDERISLSDRFGLKLHFLKPLMREYLEVVEFLAEKAGIPLPNAELERAATAYATRVGHRSPREAQLFMQEFLAKDRFL